MKVTIEGRSSYFFDWLVEGMMKLGTPLYIEVRLFYNIYGEVFNTNKFKLVLNTEDLKDDVKKMIDDSNDEVRRVDEHASLRELEVEFHKTSDN